MRLIDIDAEIHKIADEIQRIKRRIQCSEENREDRNTKIDVNFEIKQLTQLKKKYHAC